MPPVLERDVERETMRTPSGEIVSVPVVRRRSWVALIVLLAVLLLVILALLLTHIPPATHPSPNANPSGSSQPQQQQP